MKNPTFLLMPLLMVTVISANPLGKLRDQHTFLKTSEILKIPKQFQKNLPDPNDNPYINPNPNDPDCVAMCKETSDGFPFCDCQHEVPIQIQPNKVKAAATLVQEPTSTLDPLICCEICKETWDGFPICDCSGPDQDLCPEFLKAKENNDTIPNPPEPEEPDCNEVCKTTTDGFPVCDCGGPNGFNIPIKNIAKAIKNRLQHLLKDETDPIPEEIDIPCCEICQTESMIVCDCSIYPPDVNCLEFLKVKENNDTIPNPPEPEEPDCNEVCKQTTDGFPVCDCGGPNGFNIPIKNIAKAIKNRLNNLLKDDKTNCTEVCKNTSDGFPVCDCTDPENGNEKKLSKVVAIKNLFKEEDPTNCTEVCKNTSDGFPICDCDHPDGPKSLNNHQKSPKLIPKSHDDNNSDLTNCTEVCKNTSDGFPVCDCTHPDGPKLLKHHQKSPKLIPKSHDDNNSDLYDCVAICQNTSDGFPMCDCNSKPPTPIQKPKIQKRKRILPIQLFKNQRILPFANYYP